MAKTCSVCGKRAYSDYCVQHKPRKPIKQKGKRTIVIDEWVDKVARPYLDKNFGRVCAACAGTRCFNQQLDVDHIKNKGSHPELAMVLSNVQYPGRFPCHFEKTNNIKKA